MRKLVNLLSNLQLALAMRFDSWSMRNLKVHKPNRCDSYYTKRIGYFKY